MSACFRKSLQGLDSYMAEGGQAFEDLLDVAQQLGQFGKEPKWVETMQATLKASKQYLKTDYKVCFASHVSACLSLVQY